jgi:hypothetical protein
VREHDRAGRDCEPRLSRGASSRTLGPQGASVAAPGGATWSARDRGARRAGWAARPALLGAALALVVLWSVLAAAWLVHTSSRSAAQARVELMLATHSSAQPSIAPRVFTNREPCQEEEPTYGGVDTCTSGRNSNNLFH